MLFLLLKFALVILLIYICLYVYSNVVYYRNPLSRIPGRPASNPIVGNFKEYIDSNCQLFNFLKEDSRHGTVRTFSMVLGKIRLIVSDPVWIKHILSTNSKNYVRGEFLGAEDLFIAVGENGLIVVNGERHKRLRKTATPAFKLSNLKSFMPVIEMCSRRMVDLIGTKCTEDNRRVEVDIKEILAKTTLDIIGLIAFGYDLRETCSFKTGTFGCDMREWMEHKFSLFALCPYWLNLSFKRLVIKLARYTNIQLVKLANTTNNVHDFVAELVKQNLENRKNKSDENQQNRKSLLDFMLDSPEAAIGNLNQQEIHDTLMTFLIAGHETSSSAVTWTLYLLSMNQDCQDRCRKEAREFFLACSERVHWDDLKRLTYITAVTHESLRLYPPIPWLNRFSVEVDEIAGYRIPPNTDILTIMAEMHRNAEYWPCPDDFLPERFLEAHDSIPWDCFMPFGDGAHKCIGYQLALSEIVYLLADLLNSYRFDIEGEEQYRECAVITMQPKPPLKLFVEKAE